MTIALSGAALSCASHPEPEREAPVFLADAPARPAGAYAPATVEVGQAKLDVTFEGAFPVSRDAMLAWIAAAADTVSRYYGRFPVRRVRVQIRGDRPGRIGSGWEFGGRFVRADVGRSTRQADLDDDWTLVHEFFHLGFPDVNGRHEWMEEGLSTYLEPVARARVGNITTERFWREMVRSLPQGLPHLGDRGLDNTITWGRTYWGGCLFWLLADVRIRQETDNKKSLDDAIRAILEAGGDGGAVWDQGRIVSVGDKATGTTVLRDLYEKLGKAPGALDLVALWKQLGVINRDGTITFNDDSPLAAVRKAITAEQRNPAKQPRRQAGLEK